MPPDQLRAYLTYLMAGPGRYGMSQPQSGQGGYGFSQPQSGQGGYDQSNLLGTGPWDASTVQTPTGGVIYNSPPMQYTGPNEYDFNVRASQQPQQRGSTQRRRPSSQRGSNLIGTTMGGGSTVQTPTGGIIYNSPESQYTGTNLLDLIRRMSGYYR